jgi:hypothetical protein
MPVHSLIATKVEMSIEQLLLIICSRGSKLELGSKAYSKVIFQNLRQYLDRDLFIGVNVLMLKRF